MSRWPAQRWQRSEAPGADVDTARSDRPRLSPRMAHAPVRARRARSPYRIFWLAFAATLGALLMIE